MNKDKKVNIIQSILNKPSLGYTDNFSKREMWKVIAKEFNGEFKIKHNSGNEIEIHNIKRNKSCQAFFMLFFIVDSSIHQSPKHYLYDYPMRRNRGVRVNVRSVSPILDEPVEILEFPNEGLLQ